jgi:Tol biopolymer transport system component
MGEPKEVLRYRTDLYEAVPSPDGEYLLVRSGTGADSLRRDILASRLGTDSVVPLTANPYNERALSFSPDGRFVLYESDETGQTEVYVRPFPANDDLKIVSVNGGVMPLWSRRGNEIFYVDQNGNMTVARVETYPQFDVTGYETLFPIPENILFRQLEWYTLYDIAPGDDRFLMIRVLDSEEAQIQFHLVQK